MPLAETIEKLPPLRRSPRAHVAWKRRLRRLGRVRRRAFERMGSDRYSRPALHGMDRALEGYLPERGGFFVEAGANDGYVQSNTYFFERMRGWSGVLVEPIPELCEVCRVERPGARVFNCALVSRDRLGATVKMIYGDLQSVVEGTRDTPADDVAHAKAGRAALEVGWDRGWEAVVPARTLSSILDEVGAPEVDLLSLDVEGFEADVLMGLDLERHAPRYVLVEIAPERWSRARVEAVLGDRYEPVEKLSPMDVLYRHARALPG